MKIDAHQHYWNYRANDFPWITSTMPVLQQDYLPQDCQSALLATWVQGTIAVQARTVAEETDFLLHIAARNPEVLGVIGWADLGADDLAQRLDTWCTNPAFKGLRHILQDEPQPGDWVKEPAHNRSLKLLQKRGLVYEVLVFHHQLPLVLDFCAQHAQHWLVLDHAAKPPLRQTANAAEATSAWAANIKKLAALPHVACKLSGLVTETDWQLEGGLTAKNTFDIEACFDTVLHAFGPERLMYGSDWPVCKLAATYSQVHTIANNWAQSRLTPREQAAFWGGTAQRCYRLNLP